MKTLDQIAALTRQEKNVEIALHCGFTRYGERGFRSGDMREWNPPKEPGPLKAMFAETMELPNFSGSLDAMALAEATLTPKQKFLVGGYADQLEALATCRDMAYFATADQRATAFIFVMQSQA